MKTLFASLRTRIFLACALVAVGGIGAALMAVNSVVTAQAEQELQRGLEDAANLVVDHQRILLGGLRTQARLMADLPLLKAAVETRDAPTVQSLAETLHRQAPADLFVVRGRDGQALADAGGRVRGAPLEPAPPGLRESAAVWPSDGGVIAAVTTPIWIEPASPEVLGALTVGLHLDAAARARQLTDGQVIFALNGRPVAGTLEGADRDAVADWLARGAQGPLSIGDEEYAGAVRRLPVADAAVLAGGGAVDPAPSLDLVVLRSRTERLAVLAAVRAALGVTAVALLLLAILLSYGVARTITRPLGAITGVMRETAASGDLTRRIDLPDDPWQDEDARLLARSYNAMTESIGRFQREAAQRERLSSLGRLSTVLAHEVRNPLMIVKAALRSLRQPGATTDQVHTAAADIDEEVVRLNRLVNDVLDYARPIRFALQPADLSRICQDAASAATADGGQPNVVLRLDPTAASVVTDAERLRTALVNLLANARQATASEQSRNGGGPAPDVELETRAVRDDRIQVVIRDRGVGIPPAELPRVFEPFFTTRRAGSGIGLAIVRTIAEGLGGSVRLESQDGQGATAIVELPRDSRPAGDAASAARVSA
jgi:signal transduction histidine kinase